VRNDSDAEVPCRGSGIGNKPAFGTSPRGDPRNPGEPRNQEIRFPSERLKQSEGPSNPATPVKIAPRLKIHGWREISVPNRLAASRLNWSRSSISARNLQPGHSFLDTAFLPRSETSC